MNPQELLDSFIEEAPAEKRAEIVQRFTTCVKEILDEYLSEYHSPFEALQAAATDQEEFAAEHGTSRFMTLVDDFVIQELYRKTLN